MPHFKQATKSPAGKAKAGQKKKAKKSKDTGVVFDAHEQKLSEAALKAAFANLSYDPHELTEQILAFGKFMTGIPLYDYQEAFAYRAIFAVITFENETLTALWSRQCIRRGSLIHTRDGRIIPIERDELAWMTKKKAPIWVVKCRGGQEVEGTGNHPIFTDRGWVNIEDLKKTDRVCVSGGFDRWGNDRIRHSYQRFVNMHSTEDVTMDYRMTPEKAELLGWLTADGSVGLKGQSIKFTNNNPLYLDRVKYLVRRNFKDIIIKEYAKGKGKDLLLTTGIKNRFNTLKEFIVSCRFNEGGFPEVVADSCSRACVEAFFKGLYPADGYVHFKQNATSGKGKYKRKWDYECGMCCGNSKQFAWYVRELLNKLGVCASVKHEYMAKGTGFFYRVVFSGLQNAHHFNKAIGKIYGKKALPEESYSEYRRGKEIGEDGEQLHFTNIIFIKKTRFEDEVWDIVVPKKHWFLCQGVKVHNSGKSEDIAFVCITLMVILPAIAEIYPELAQFKEGFKVGLYAPQQLQVDTTYDRAIERISTENAAQILEELESELYSSKYLHLTNKSALTGQVASKTSKIESKTYHFIIVEESQDTDDFVVQKSIEPMLSATGGTLLKVGTTGTYKNNFWRDIQDNKKRSRAVQDKRLIYHFEFDYRMVIASKRRQYEKDGNLFHLNYEKDVMKKRNKWGEDSDAFKLGYALIWPLESGMFITDGQFDRMVNKRLGKPDELQPEWTIVAGLDYGKDQDSTVLTVGRTFYRNDEYTTEPPQKQVFDWLELHGSDYDTQHHFILDFIIAWGIEVLYCDYTGVGKGPTDRLMAACGDAVLIIPYTFSRPSKSDMWVALDADIRAGRMIVPGNKVVANTQEYVNFENQMKGLFKWFDQGYMVCQHGDETGAHDDYCDSLGLFCLAGNHELPDEVEESDNMFFGRNNGYESNPRARNAHW